MVENELVNVVLLFNICQGHTFGLAFFFFIFPGPSADKTGSTLRGKVMAHVTGQVKKKNTKDSKGKRDIKHR